MIYEGAVYRPPSEAKSLIIQITIGCSHNKCTFCTMYKGKKFRIRNLEEVYGDLIECRKYYNHVERIFLADGNGLAVRHEDLKNICLKIRDIFPECSRIGIYASARDVLRKTSDELKELRELGLGIIYMGVESGSDDILLNIKKGVTSSEIIEAGRRIKGSGIRLSITLISGIGGKEMWKEHALQSAKVMNAIDPEYIGFLTLMVEENSEIYKDIKEGKMTLLTPQEIMVEIKEFIKQSHLTNCIFRSNHASNYISLNGTLPYEKDKLLAKICEVMDGKYKYKSDIFRAL